MIVSITFALLMACSLSARWCHSKFYEDVSDNSSMLLSNDASMFKFNTSFPDGRQVPHDLEDEFGRTDESFYVPPKLELVISIEADREDNEYSKSSNTVKKNEFGRRRCTS